jgi:uncharacterized membrane protein YfcA
MEVMTALVIIIVGLAVGLLSGLVGIGGGVLIVPFLYFFYDRPDLFGVVVSPEARAVLAHGTSLFVILPTSLRGAMAYHRARLVEWRAVWPIGASAVVAAFVGAHLAVRLPPEALKTGFGVLLIFSGVRLAYRRGEIPASEGHADPKVNLSLTLPSGILVGLFSSLLGVGGGIVAIPILIYLLKFDVKQVAATSIGIIALTSAAGTVGYMMTGFGAPGLPSWTLGYVDLSAGILMLPAAILSVKWGAELNQRMRPRTLEIFFGILFVLIGLRLAGANLWTLLNAAV